MSRFRPLNLGRIALAILGALAFPGGLIQPSLATDAAPAAEERSATKNLARMNCGATIDCITPDGRLIAVPSAGEKNLNAAALIRDGDTLSCPLQEGETTFIISIPKTALLDRFTFINENAEVQGEMKIAVSNDRLPADSPKWTDVNGKTAFTSKRLFNLSMVGVEARYVKLSFQVQKGGNLAAIAENPGDLTGAKYISSVADRNADGKADVDFDPQGARSGPPDCEPVG
jgi:hypothetical protein